MPLFQPFPLVRSSLALALAGLAQAEVALVTGWESQFILEGRRVLDTAGGIGVADLTISGRQWFLESWNAFSPHAEFWQAQLSVGLTQDLGPLECSCGYTLVKVWDHGADGTPDHEAFLSLVLPLGDRTALSFDGVFGYQAHGGYGELTLTRELLATGRLTWAVHASVAWDFGYASHEFDGICHSMLGSTVECLLGDDWVAAVFLHTILPFEDVERAGGDSLAYGGVSLGRAF